MTARGDRPAIVVVDGDERTRALVEANLRRRYEADYRIIAADGPQSASAALAEIHGADGEVALITATERGTDDSGTRFLGRTRADFPTARRMALGSYLDVSVMKPIARASTLGEIDAFETLPWSESDERFLATLGSMLADWAREHDRIGPGISIVSDRGDADAQSLGDILVSWGIPVRLLEANSSAGEELIRDHGADAQLPLLILSDGRVLSGATLATVTDAFGYGTGSPATDFDVVVLGLGPAGMSAVVNAASEGLKVLVVEWTLSQAASSPMIRNYVGFPAGVTGAELLRRAWYQAAMFGFEARVGRYATSIEADGDRHVVMLDDGSRVRTASVLLATGAAYRRIGIPSVDRLVGRGVFYGYGAPEAQALSGESVVIVGGANSAVQAAAHLARYAGQVRLIVRGPSLSDTASEYLIEQVANLGNVSVHLRTEVAEARDAQQLRSLVLRDKAAGTETEVEATGLFILIGAVPRTDWLPDEIARDEKEYVLTGDDVPATAGDAKIRRLPLETSVPGIFAAGDVRHGSVKRVAPAVGEGAAAIAQLIRYLGSRDTAGERTAVPVGPGSRQ